MFGLTLGQKFVGLMFVLMCGLIIDDLMLFIGFDII